MKILVVNAQLADLEKNIMLKLPGDRGKAVEQLQVQKLYKIEETTIENTVMSETLLHQLLKTSTRLSL
jgi:hypothetical protein